MLLIKPGAIGPLVSLQEARRQSYESLRTLHNAAVSRRRENGIPLTDSIDWKFVEGAVASAKVAVDGQNIEDLRKSIADVSEATKVSVSEWGPYQPNPGIDGISVRLRTVSAETRADILGIGAELSRELSSLPESSVRDRLLKDVELQRAQMRFVQHSLAYIDGLQLVDDLSKPGELVPFSASAESSELLADVTVEMLRDAGILLDLFIVCRDFQGLSPLERGRYGLQAQST